MSGHVAAIWQHRDGSWCAGCTTGTCRWHVLHLPNMGEAHDWARDHMDEYAPPPEGCTCFIQDSWGKTEFTGACRVNHDEEVTA